MTAPRAKHWTTIKRDLRYVKETSDFGILYGKGKEIQVYGYLDLDWARSMDDVKSTSS